MPWTAVTRSLRTPVISAGASLGGQVAEPGGDGVLLNVVCSLQVEESGQTWPGM